MLKSPNNRILERAQLSVYLETFDFNNEKAGFVADITLSGLLLICDGDLPVDDTIFIKLSTKEITNKLAFIDLELLVIRTSMLKSGKNEIGCKFKNKLTEEAEKSISQFIVYLGSK